MKSKIKNAFNISSGVNANRTSVELTNNNIDIFKNIGALGLMLPPKMEDENGKSILSSNIESL